MDFFLRQKNKAAVSVSSKKETVCITGASSGIGQEFTDIFAREGYSLVLVARNREKLEELKKKYEQAYQSSVFVIVQDLSLDGASGNIMQKLNGQNISIDILVNNAGLGSWGPFWEEDVTVQRSLLMVNMVALTQLTRYLLPWMIEKNRGKILNVSSIAGFTPGPGMAVYFATKAYVLSFSQSLAEELSHTKISITTLCPGPTRTSFFKDEDQESLKGYTDPAWVASYGYCALMRGRRIAIPEWKWRALLFIQRFLSRSFVSRVVARMIV